jgi:Tol biopolymer transport system component
LNRNRTRRVFRLAPFLAGGLVLLALIAVFFEFLTGSRLRSAQTPSPLGTEKVPAATQGAGEAAATPSPVQADSQPEAGLLPIPSDRLIAFTSRRDGNEEIYVMNAAGRDLANLTDHPAADNLPAWSPDGQRLAFVSDRSGKPEVYSMDASGSALTPLTDLPNVKGFASLSWSPDGTRLAVEALLPHQATGELYGRVFLIQADGSGILDLTHNDLPKRVSNPQWSPGGEWVSFVQGGEGPRHLRSVQPDGTRDTQLTPRTRNTRAFRWSPDGARLAYITSCAYCGIYDGEPADLRIAIPGGPETESLHRFDGLSLDFYNLSWSPQGSYLAFTATVGGERINHLYLLELEGQELLDFVAFEPGRWFLSSLSWAPDGSRLVFDAGREGQRSIYVANLEARLRGGVGAGVTNLTPDSPGLDYQPQFQP